MPQPLAVTAFMASPGRFELPAPRLGGVCSIQLSYGDIFNLLWSRMEQLASQDFDDLIIRRRTLYPGEVRGHGIMRCILRTGIYSFYIGTHNIISLLHQLGNVNKITCQEHVKMRKVCFGTRKGLHGGVENAMIKLRKMG